MPWSTPDITTVADDLVANLNPMVQGAAAGGGFSVNINQASPETARKSLPAQCQLSFYLMHVGRDAYWRNTPVDGARPQNSAAQPLSLNLYFLLSAYADARYDWELLVMSVALQYFHSNPIYRRLSGTTVDEEFTISIEADTIEEMSRLWQAFTVPMRLSCVVKVGIVFVAPTAPPKLAAKRPVTANVAVGPRAATGDPVALYGAMNLAFAPYPPPTDATEGRVAGGELVAVASRAGTADPKKRSNVLLRGASLDQPPASQVFLSTPDGASEWRLAPAWRLASTDPGLLELVLPSAYLAAAPSSGTILASVPPPGIYRLAVGRSAGGNPRSNRVPLVIAARLDDVTGPVGGKYTVTGDGFAPGATTILVGGVDATASATIAAGAINFPLPAALPAGTHAVSITVNAVPCLPGAMVTK